VGSIRSFVRPPQRIILDMDDIDDPSRNLACCAVTHRAPAPVLPADMCRDYARASPGTIFARVETTPMGTEVRFIITNPRRARQGALRKVFWPVSART
jgi:hypothetical protein